MKRPSTGPVSSPSVVPAILTVAESLSIMVTVASSLAVSTSICGSPPVMPVSWTSTVSSASMTESSMMSVTSISAVVEPARMVTLPLSVV